MLVNQIDVAQLLRKKRWRDVPFWRTHDLRLISANDMTASHLMNVTRLLVNKACLEMRLPPLQIMRPMSHLNFGRHTPETWVAICRLFVSEIQRRLDIGEKVEPRYKNVLGQIEGRVRELTARSRVAGTSTEMKIAA